MDFLDFIINWIDKMLSQHWIVAVLGGGGIVLSFTICLIIGLFSGDFMRNKKAIKRIAMGNIEAGLIRLRRPPEYDKRREISPPVWAFDYNKIVAHPYSYSTIKKLPAITFVFTALFTALCFSASLIIDGLTHYSTFILMFLPLLGTVLYIIGTILSTSLLKQATNIFYNMIELIKDITSSPKCEGEVLPQQVHDFLKKLDKIAISGGAGYKELSKLFDEITMLLNTFLDKASQDNLSYALDTLSLLIDSAL